MVAGEQPVELEGGEWIIPKEAVPDYLPVLKQITNEGRAMQQMDNGNTAMDALIASASMESGITQPKSPMYQEGGQVDYSKTSGLYNRFLAELGAPEMMGMKDISRYRALQDPESRSPEMYDAQSEVGRQFSKDALLNQALLNAVGGDASAEDTYSLVKGLSPAGRKLYYSQYFDDKEQGGPIKQYGHGGQMQPRKQQEIRNPQVYGPPAPANMDSVLKQIMIRDVNQSINPFTGDTINAVLDSLKHKQKLKKSLLPRTGRKNMYSGGPVMYQQGGPVMYANGGQLGEGQPLERRMSPSEQLEQLQRMETRPQGSLMSAVEQDGRIKPLQPDTYIIKDGAMSSMKEEVNAIPKLSTAYLAAFGFETPFSRRQKALIKTKMIEPESLSAQTKGLIGRALLQRLANEDD
jgi:hypothetical protein